MKVSTHGYDHRTFQTLLDTAESRASTDWEESFITSLQERWAKYGATMFLSIKQLNVLKRMLADEDGQLPPSLVPELPGGKREPFVPDNIDFAPSDYQPFDPDYDDDIPF